MPDNHARAANDLEDLNHLEDIKCFPIGRLFLDAPSQEGEPSDCSPLVTRRWPDGSVCWAIEKGVMDSIPRSPVSVNQLQVSLASSHRLSIRSQGEQLPEYLLRFPLVSSSGHLVEARLENLQRADADTGADRYEMQGSFPGTALQLVVELFLTGVPGLLRLDVRLHNPECARHRSGLWDLGDAGSALFRAFDVVVERHRSAGTDAAAVFAESLGGCLVSVTNARLFQASSGGMNWQSETHLTRAGTIPCLFRGYRIELDGRKKSVEEGRAEPAVAISDPHGSLAVALPRFWEQFPKSIAVNQGQVRVGLFPSEWPEHHELQGGERKTHTLWLAQSNAEDPHQAVRVLREQRTRTPRRPKSAEILAAGAVPYALLEPPVEGSFLGAICQHLLAGPQSLLARREAIDEYGWRNFGDVWANHEQTHSRDQPLVSHYNNQFDLLYGLQLAWLSDGQRAWHDLAGDLARHVGDIDIYHTDRDRAAYNGGLFWHTDHHLPARTATHRTYSVGNRQPAQDYGGGPSNEHNYTSGLALHYCLTGEPSAREAVLKLAQWVIRMDDGRRTVFGLVDDGPTGLASATRSPDYHGPGRGSGNSINALLDAWQLTNNRDFLLKAEELLHRCFHPSDDVPARELLDAENRWSYTVFLAAVVKYLDAKRIAEQFDTMFDYARDALVAYVQWMIAYERPYLDCPEALEFVTETWPAQEMRKANVLRMAASYLPADDRDAAYQRGAELADRAWADWAGFEERFSTRSVTILLTEGFRDAYFRVHGPRPGCDGPCQTWGPPPAPFLSQKQRVLRRMRTPAGAVAATCRLASPGRWLRFTRLRRGGTSE